GGWQGTHLEALLPVLLDLPEREDEATLALALVIDRSGSMAGPKMELTKEAARATVEMLPPSDLVAIAVFDSQAAPIVHLQRASNRVRILTDIGRIQPSGGTNILAGPRPRAELLLAAPNGAPLLARWQVGLGQVAAWTSDVEPRWSAAWMRWPPFAKFWAQVTRATMRRRAANHFPLRATLDGDRVT